MNWVILSGPGNRPFSRAILSTFCFLHIQIQEVKCISARCPHLPPGTKGCAGKEDTNAQTSAYSAFVMATGAEARWQQHQALTQSSTAWPATLCSAQLVSSQKPVCLRAGAPLDLQESLRIGYITWPIENLNQRLFPFMFSNINNDNLNLTSPNSGKCFM